ncbi:hypothetical protein PI124_g2812 [Phytophthora idaei]|nr:hypothetical protein PI125_g2116 [Phytophthora idaei]KAG3169533.1 hypothetical protein PI126_g2777 [Phytophthora idaei]KAG3252572.1 hypothetical protein PI124_g2812 [Phytophthora idaei]
MRSLVVTCMAITGVCWAVGVSADFNQCLGLEMATLLTTPSCMELFSTCQVGVNKLNQKLGTAYQPVSVISASESETVPENSTKIAMLVQLAPLTDCLSASATTTEDSCKFDMSKVEFYSILLTHDFGASWKLEGYKRHSLSDEERAQIVEEYNSGQFYGSKLAIGIFDANNLPFESDSKETAPRAPIAVVAASVSALFCLGLVLHQRRRLQNGYAPIHLSKRGHVQGKKSPTAKDAPEERSLRPADAAGTGGQTFKQETNERFAV